LKVRIVPVLERLENAFSQCTCYQVKHAFRADIAMVNERV